MNWRKSDKELSALYDSNPWLYVIEWRERLTRCVMHLSGVRGMTPQEVEWEAKELREAADDLIKLAEYWESEAKKQARIEALRNVEGRTPEEAAVFLAKADKLEAGV